MRPNPSLHVLLLLAPALAPAGGPPREVDAVLQNHCFECHDSDLRKGGLDLQALSTDFSSAAAQKWVLVHDRIRSGEMPPAKVKERPASNEVAAVTGWIGREATAAETSRRQGAGRVALRRLNRVEYENTVRDLLGVEVDLKDLLPEDPQVHGFDTVAEGLRLSSLHLEKYLEAADAALDAAIQLTQAPERLDQRFTFKEDKAVRENLDTPAGTVTNPNSKNTHKVILLETGDGVVFFGEGYPPAELRALSIKSPGRYRFTVSAAAFQSPDRPVVARFYRNRGGDKRLLQWFDIPSGAGREFQVEADLQTGDKVEFSPWDVGFDEQGKTVWNAEGARSFTGRGMLIRHVRVEGPLGEAWPPESTARLFEGLELKPHDRDKVVWVNHKATRYAAVSADPPADLRRLVERWATRAFRRPLRAGEAGPFVRLGEDVLAGGAGFEMALRASLRGILTAPQFLLRMESPGPLDPHALATRLSLFLWSRAPDAALLARAADGSLARPDVLRAEALRLLDSPRAAEFVTHFAGQWLDLRGIDATTPDMKLYPEYDELLKHSMVRETESFLRECLDRNQPAADLVDSAFLMVNRRLAEHYGLEGIEGEQIRRVPRPAGSPRGGLLTQASVLKVTANGTVSSPVLRGAWVMKRLLGEPPPPPPASVGSIEPDTRGATTIREQLDKHRSSESCASCHRVMDPPGFALENFDVIGGWRDHYRSQDKGKWERVRLRTNSYAGYKQGPPVDASGELPDGRAFAGIVEFKALLLERREQVARALVQHLLVYGTGAEVRFADRPEVERILRETAASGHGLRDLVISVVLSDLFRSK